MKKADYSKIASHYDKGRPLLQTNISLWMELIASHMQSDNMTKMLDLGCGTGRFSLPLATELDLKVTGADSSSAMLDKAQKKDIDKSVNWEIQDADNLTYSDNSFDYIFMSHLLHHVNNPASVLENCFRALNKSGAVLIRYGAIEQIKDDPEHKYFPGVSEIDEARTPSVRQVEQWLTEAGFERIKSTEVVQQTYASAQLHYEALLNKGISVLNMITPDEFSQGLMRFENYMNENQDDPWLVTDLLTMTVGYKR